MTKLFDFQKPKTVPRNKYCENDLSCIMRKHFFCIFENKGAVQLRGNRTADQRLHFHYIDSNVPILPKSAISSLQPFFEAVQLGFLSDLVGSPNDKFFRAEAHLIIFDYAEVTRLDVRFQLGAYFASDFLDLLSTGANYLPLLSIIALK